LEPESTILIVDDEPVGRDTLEALLTNQGYRLCFASDGYEALSVAADVRPDLILLDVMMPGMDGFEVCRRLRADASLAEVPVVMVTALDDQDSCLRGIEAGADDFITKPFNRAELRARARTITRLNRYRALLVGRARFEWVIDHAADGYLIIDGSDRVLYANELAHLYLDLGDAPEMGPGEGFVSVARRRYRCEPRDAWASWPEVDRGSHVRRYLVQPESLAAHAFWLQVDVLADAPGAARQRVVRLRDVTAEMAQQREVRSFHRAISHKLRTPLTGMLGSLELLTCAADTLTTQEVIEFARMAHDSARRLQESLEDVLSYLGAAGLAWGTDRIQLGELQELALDLARDLGIEAICVDLPTELAGLSVLLSKRGVELALWEVLDNAIKFHPARSPTVDVSISRVDDRHVSVQVMDDGVMLSPEQLSQLWTPYYQGEKYFTGEAHGMGLGLATVASLVWEVGGTCRARNRQDRPGVIVELILPVEGSDERTSQ